jgi:hypothetical protein
MNREQWLNSLMKKMAPIVAAAYGDEWKEIDMSTWRVSCGWPGGGSRNKRIGECWSTQASKGGRTEMFISPLLEKATDVDHVLIHEMVHATVGVKHGHKGPFAKLARKIGLAGKLTSTHAGDDLRARLDIIIAKMPEYPHSSMSPMGNGMKKQSTRMLKLECDECGYVVRTTQKWINVGVPVCHCGAEFQVRL